MTNLFAPAHLALTVVILIWNVVLAGRIAQNRQAPSVFQAVSGLAALLIFPGLMFTLATSTIMTGRAVATMDWVWPAVLVLFAIQAIYAVVRRLVNWAWGFPIAIYNILIAIDRRHALHGRTRTDPRRAARRACWQPRASAWSSCCNTASVLASPFFLNMPMVSPAFPAIRKTTATFRAFMSLVAVAWTVAIIAIGGPRAVVQLRNYEVHRRDQLRERPDGGFRPVGVEISACRLLRPPSPPSAIRSDSALIDTLSVDAVSVVVVPGASRASIDSLARVIDPARRDSTILIVALGYRGKLVPELRREPLDETTRLITLRQVIERLHPDIVLPAEDPYTLYRLRGSSARCARPVEGVPHERSASPPRASTRTCASVSPRRRTHATTASCTRGRRRRRRRRSTSSASRSSRRPMLAAAFSRTHERPIAGCVQRRREKSTGSSPREAIRSPSVNAVRKTPCGK